MSVPEAKTFDAIFFKKYTSDIASTTSKIPDVEFFLQAHRKLAIDIEDVMTQVTQSLGKYPFSVACKKGCSYCCTSLYVQSYDIEVKTILTYVRDNWKSEQQDMLRSRIASCYERLKGKDKSQYVALHVSCPFLRAGACSIYEIRPLACAQFTSASRARCKHIWQAKDGRIPIESSALHRAAAMSLATAIATHFGATAVSFIDELYRQTSEIEPAHISQQVSA